MGGITLTRTSRNQILFMYDHRKHRIALKLNISFCENPCSSVAKPFSVNFGWILWLKKFMDCSFDHSASDILYLFRASKFVFRIFLARKNTKTTTTGLLVVILKLQQRRLSLFPAERSVKIEEF